MFKNVLIYNNIIDVEKYTEEGVIFGSRLKEDLF